MQRFAFRSALQTMCPPGSINVMSAQWQYVSGVCKSAKRPVLFGNAIVWSMETCHFSGDSADRSWWSMLRLYETSLCLQLTVLRQPAMSVTANYTLHVTKDTSKLNSHRSQQCPDWPVIKYWLQHAGRVSSCQYPQTALSPRGSPLGSQTHRFVASQTPTCPQSPPVSRPSTPKAPECAQPQVTITLYMNHHHAVCDQPYLP